MNDYLVRWGNFIILNINLQAPRLGEEIEKKKTLGIRMFLLFYSSTPRNQVRFFCVKIDLLNLLMRNFREDRKHGIPPFQTSVTATE